MKLFNKEYKSVYIVSLIFIIVFSVFYYLEFIVGIEIFLSRFENRWFDTKFNDFVFLSPPVKKADDRIIVVGIDNDTIEKYSWPIKRHLYKKLFDNLNKYGVKVIALDIMFSEESNPIDDKILAESAAEYDNVVFAVYLDERGNLKVPVDVILKKNRHFAHVSASSFIGKDGKIRRIAPFFREVINYIDGKEFKRIYSYSSICDHCGNYSDVGIPLLGTYAYMYYTSKNLRDFYYKWYDKDRKIVKSFMLNFRKRREGGSLTSMYDYVSMQDVIDDTLDDGEKYKLKNAIVFVGSLATGAFDHYPSPVGESTPGVEFHALCADNLLHNDYLRTFNRGLSYLILIASIMLPVLLIGKTAGFLTFINLVYIFILMLISRYLIRENYNFYFMPFFISNIITYTYVIAYKSMVEDKQKRWIKSTFSQYLAPSVVEALLKDPSKLKLGGEKKDMTVLFMDIAGFTSLSEKMKAEEITFILNTYLSALSDIILEHNGVIDKYIGDCIMAFWNAPVDIPKHRTVAVKSAIKCVEKLDDLNKQSNQKISVRVGINSGEMVVGNMGSDKRFSYTVLGDNVNLASRLEGANKFFKSKIMVSEDVYNEAKEEIVFKFLGRILVVGKTQPVKVYEPLCVKDNLSETCNSFIENYNKGIENFYNRNYKQALNYFNKANEIIQDGPVNFYIEVCSEFIEKGDDNFDGVFNIRSK